jgi:hypothetical protein
MRRPRDVLRRRMRPLRKLPSPVRPRMRRLSCERRMPNLRCLLRLRPGARRMRCRCPWRSPRLRAPCRRGQAPSRCRSRSPSGQLRRSAAVHFCPTPTATSRSRLRKRRREGLRRTGLRLPRRSTGVAGQAPHRRQDRPAAPALPAAAPAPAAARPRLCSARFSSVSWPIPFRSFVAIASGWSSRDRSELSSLSNGLADPLGGSQPAPGAACARTLHSSRSGGRFMTLRPLGHRYRAYSNTPPTGAPSVTGGSR